MTKDVLVSISGLQMAVSEMESNDDEPIEVVSAGTYYFKDGKHYIFFEEVAEGLPGVTKTQIRLTGKEALEVMKKSKYLRTIVAIDPSIDLKGEKNAIRYSDLLAEGLKNPKRVLGNTCIIKIPTSIKQVA